MIRYTKNITTALLLGALAGLFTGCAQDDLEAPRPVQTVSPDTQLVINLAVPRGNTSSSDESRATMTPTDAEGRINTLRFLAFSTNGAEVINRNLPIPSETPYAPDKKTVAYEIKDVNPADYNIYVVANLTGAESIKTEADLMALMMDFSQKMPEPGNLPMVYKSPAAIVIGPSSVNPAEITCSMTIAAVKVRYSIIFDPTDTQVQEVFGSNGLRIKSVDVANAATKAYAVHNTSYTSAPVTSLSPSGQYWSGGNFAVAPGNASQNDKDVVTLTGDGSDKPASYAGKWVLNGTIYMPERYVAIGGSATTMTLPAVLTTPAGADGTVTTSYSINLADYDGAPANTLSLDRGAYYEVVARVRSLGDADLETTITRKDWTETLVELDMVSTYLRLSKTSAAIESLTEDVISYDTDGSAQLTNIECKTNLQGKPVVLVTEDKVKKTLTLSVNPDIDVTVENFQGKGTAKLHITAGNITKVVDVEYDITPFFTITPLFHKIQYNSSEPSSNEKEFEYVTNLGGVLITKLGDVNTVYIGSGKTSYTSYAGYNNSSRLVLSCQNPNAAKGVIKVVASDPGTTVSHFFSAFPVSTRYQAAEKEDLQVTINPDFGPYRIYFRAINDWQKYAANDNASTSVGEFLEGFSSFPTEQALSATGSTGNNWIDGWSYNNNNATNDIYWNQANNQFHHIYIYGQEGETGPGYTHESWHFFSLYSGAKTMTSDNNNPGWYYFNGLTPDTKPIEWEQQHRRPEPGKTLLMFYATGNGTKGFEVHRGPHHNDPGIPLFDFEDREGYIVYDPTSEPYYRIYDEKPIIEDVEYTVYSTEKITKWEQTYGVADGSTSLTPGYKQYTMWGNISSNGIYTKQTSAASTSGTVWYKTVIKLKAPMGDYEKAIKLIGLTPGNGSDTPVDTNRYVYVGVKNNSSLTPFIHLWDAGSEKTTWGNLPAMTHWDTQENGALRIFRYAIPSGKLGCLFANSRNGGDASKITGNLTIDNGKTMIYYTDTKAWMEYNPGGSTTSTKVMLFGGRSYKAYNHQGTYINGRWYGGKHSSVPAGL